MTGTDLIIIKKKQKGEIYKFCYPETLLKGRKR